MAGIIGLIAFDKVWNVVPFIKYGLMGLQHRGYLVTSIATIGMSVRTERTSPEDFNIEGISSWAGIGFTGSRGNIIKIEEGALAVDGILKSPERLMKELLIKPDKAINENGIVGSFVFLSKDGTMIAYRDETGNRPLWLGGFGFDMAIISSEPTGIEVIGGETRKEIDPGEMVIASQYYVDTIRVKKPSPFYCSIEYVYQERIDSIFNSKNIYDVRIRIGEELAKERPIKADIVVGVPDTAIPFAIGYSRTLGLRFDLGFARTGSPIRTMLTNDDFMKLVGVQLKLNPISSIYRDKKVVVIDDSMVTGTTIKHIAFMLRKLGAREVHVLIGSPKLTSSCPYNIDIPSEDLLISANLDEERISRELGVDSIYWLSIEGLYRAVGTKNLCLGCVLKKYPKVI